MGQPTFALRASVGKPDRMMSSVEIHDRLATPTVAVLTLGGRLTVNDQPGRLKSAVAKVLSQGARHVILDLAGVLYIDSTRLGELIASHVAVTRQGGQLKFARTPARVTELLQMAGLGDLFEQFETVEDAVHRVGRDGR
jgi:anti-sigma B factor antagonist